MMGPRGPCAPGDGGRGSQPPLPPPPTRQPPGPQSPGGTRCSEAPHKSDGVTHGPPRRTSAGTEALFRGAGRQRASGRTTGGAPARLHRSCKASFFRTELRGRCRNCPFTCVGPAVHCICFWACSLIGERCDHRIGAQPSPPPPPKSGSKGRGHKSMARRLKLLEKVISHNISANVGGRPFFRKTRTSDG